MESAEKALQCWKNCLKRRSVDRAPGQAASRVVIVHSAPRLGRVEILYCFQLVSEACHRFVKGKRCKRNQNNVNAISLPGTAIGIPRKRNWSLFLADTLVCRERLRQVEKINGLWIFWYHWRNRRRPNLSCLFPNVYHLSKLADNGLGRTATVG